MANKLRHIFIGKKTEGFALNFLKIVLAHLIYFYQEEIYDSSFVLAFISKNL